MTLRSRKGMSSCSDRCSSISREACERAVSRKLGCRVELSASVASSSRLMRPRQRNSLRWSPAVLRLVCMNGKIVPSRGPIHYLLGNDCKKGPVLHTPAAYSNIPLITFQVIASPVATHHFRTSHPKEVVATNLVPMSRLLRLALLADAVASGATAALLVAGLATSKAGWAVRGDDA